MCLESSRYIFGLKYWVSASLDHKTHLKAKVKLTNKKPQKYDIREIMFASIPRKIPSYHPNMVSLA